MTLPTEGEVLDCFTLLSNAGPWGDNDQLGTLNFVTNDNRRTRR